MKLSGLHYGIILAALATAILHITLFLSLSHCIVSLLILSFVTVSHCSSIVFYCILYYLTVSFSLSLFMHLQFALPSQEPRR